MGNGEDWEEGPVTILRNSTFMRNRSGLDNGGVANLGRFGRLVVEGDGNVFAYNEIEYSGRGGDPRRQKTGASCWWFFRRCACTFVSEKSVLCYGCCRIMSVVYLSSAQALKNMHGYPRTSLIDARSDIRGHYQHEHRGGGWRVLRE